MDKEEKSKKIKIENNLFKKVDKEDAFNDMLSQILYNIKKEKLKPGDALPAERNLAEIFGVSRPKVREAIKALEFTGIIETVQGGANYISADLNTCMIQPISLLMQISKVTPIQCQELRISLECSAARLACINPSALDIAKLYLLMEEVNETDDVEEIKDRDFKFHLQIAKMANNPLIYSMLAASMSITEELIGNTRKYMKEKEYQAEEINKQHKELIEAISSKDAAKAEKIMRKHLQIIDEYLKKS